MSSSFPSFLHPWLLRLGSFFFAVAKDFSTPLLLQYFPSYSSITLLESSLVLFLFFSSSCLHPRGNLMGFHREIDFHCFFLLENKKHGIQSSLLGCYRNRQCIWLRQMHQLPHLILSFSSEICVCVCVLEEAGGAGCSSKVLQK